MKFFYIFLGIAFLIAMTILYFQIIVTVGMQVPFFSSYIDIRIFILYFIVLGMGCGIFLTLGIK